MVALPDTSSTCANGTGRLSGSTTRPLIGPAELTAATRINRKAEREMKGKRARTGLLLGVFTRRTSGRRRKGRPGVKYPGSRITSSRETEDSAAIEPSHAVAQWLPVRPALDRNFPLTVAEPRGL